MAKIIIEVSDGVTNGDIIQNVCSMMIAYHDKDIEVTVDKKVWNAPYKNAPYKVGEWIPVSEKLPEPQNDGNKDFSDWVQVTIDIGENNDIVGEAYYCFSENKWYTDRFVLGDVTAWMLLPKPYREVSE